MLVQGPGSGFGGDGVPAEAVVGPVVVVVDDPRLDRGEGLVEVGEVVGPDAFLLEGPVEAFDERVAVGVTVGGARQGDAERRGVLAVALGGELGAVEFLIVVKVAGGGHRGVGTGGVSERLSTPFLTRSSRRVALRALEIERRAARTSGGIW